MPSSAHLSWRFALFSLAAWGLVWACGGRSTLDDDGVPSSDTDASSKSDAPVDAAPNDEPEAGQDVRPDVFSCTPGAVDRTFAIEGITRGIFVPGDMGFITAGSPHIAVDPEGRILLAGTGKSDQGASFPVTARLLPDGTRDPDYATVLLNDRSAPLQGEHTAIAAHDGIYAVTAMSSGPTLRVRYGTDGQPVGQAYVDFAPSSHADGIVVDDAGTSTVVGEEVDTSGAQIELDIRDAKGNGIQGITIGPVSRELRAHALLMPDGSTVIGSDVGAPYFSLHTWALFRYSYPGVRFDNDFAHRSMTGPELGVSRGLALAADQSFYMAGASSSGTPVLVHYASNGAFDASFGGLGVIDLAPDTPNTIDVRAIAVDPTGNVLVSGEMSDDNGETACWLVRVRSDGSLDATFGNNGAFVLESSGGCDLAVGPNGEILLAATKAMKDSGTTDVVVARICP